MAWSASKVYAASLVQFFTRDATALDWDTDTIKVALFDNSITPDNTVSAANSALGAGVWASGQQTSSTDWPSGGVALASKTNAQSSNLVTLDAADTASGAAATLTVYGGLVYDDTATSVADQGLSYNYFGGVASVTSGTLTIVWHANGIIRHTT